ncbi:hypothetical protein KEM55_006674 [Ascosphaera atra]|nr:hypothetical protein KEM55_006674 [Ascosphaera atra]
MKCELIASLLLLPGLSFGVAIDKRAQTKVPGLTWYAGQLAPAPVAESAVDLTVKPDGGNKSSPLLWGDGGIHGQLLMNNGFQGDNPGLTAWKGVNGAKISQDRKTPLTKAITSTLKIEVPSSSDDEDLVGAANTGYNGMPVAEQRYNNYFWVRGSYKGPVTIRLVGSTSQVVYASHEVNVDSNDSRFTYYETSFNSTASPDGDNEWQFLINTSKASGKTVHLGLPQLFPPTFKNR